MKDLDCKLVSLVVKLFALFSKDLSSRAKVECKQQESRFSEGDSLHQIDGAMNMSAVFV